MAEESIDPPVTPEKNGLDSRNKGITSAGNSSSLKQESVNSSKNSIPHYLRASTGSCHDFCKYGRKHAFEEKARTPLQSRLAKTSPIELNPVETLDSGEQKKEKVVRHKPSTDTEKHAPDLKSSPDIKFYSPKPKPSLDTKTSSLWQNTSSGNKIHLPKYKPSLSKKTLSPDPPEIIKREIMLPSKKVEVPLKKCYSTDIEMLRTERKTNFLSKKSSSGHSKPVKVKPPSSSDTSDGIHGKGRRNSDVTAGRKMTESKASAQKALAPPAASLPSKLYLSKAISTKARKATNLKLLSPLKDQNSIRRTKVKTSNNRKVSEKTLHVIKTGTENHALKSIPDGHAIPTVPSPSLPKSLSHAKSANLLSHEEDAYVEAESSGSEADDFVPDNSEYTEVGKAESVTRNPSKTLRKSRVVVADDFIPDNSEHMKVGKAESVSRSPSKTLRKSRIVVSEDKYRSPVKLNFRSGRVVDLQSDNNIPRRLRFRRARVLGAQDGKGDLRRTIFKKAEGNGNKTVAQLSSEKVVLKHQEVQGKKGTQGLFNNVIEETASKLVESRKSKVKALVGAFETVISLQDSKPSSHTVS